MDNKEYKIKCPPEYIDEALHLIKAFNRDHKAVERGAGVYHGVVYKLNTGREFYCYYTNKGTTVVRYCEGQYG